MPDERQKALETAREWFEYEPCNEQNLAELILSVERKARVKALEWAIRQHICGQDAARLTREITRLRADLCAEKEKV
jgi:hypothetical protein